MDPKVHAIIARAKELQRINELQLTQIRELNAELAVLRRTVANLRGGRTKRDREISELRRQLSHALQQLSVRGRYNGETAREQDRQADPGPRPASGRPGI